MEIRPLDTLLVFSIFPGFFGMLVGASICLLHASFLLVNRLFAGPHAIYIWLALILVASKRPRDLK